MKTESTSRAAFFNSRLLICFALSSVGLLLALAGLSKSVTGLIAAMPDPSTHHQHHHYQLIDMGTLGGPQSYVNAGIFGPLQILNNRGALVGSADTSTPDPFPAFCFNSLVIPFGVGDCFVSHAFQWQNGVLSESVREMITPSVQALAEAGL